MCDSSGCWQRRAAQFLAAQGVSLLGSSMVQYAIIWYITLTTSSGKMLTLSTLCGFLPQLAVSLFGGVWADRWKRKNVMMLADAAVAAATLVLAVSMLLGSRPMWLLFAVLAVRSAGTGLQTPAAQAFLPQIVPREKLMRLGGVQSALNSLITFLSPAAGGLLLSFFPLETVLFADILTAALGIGLTAAIRVEENGGQSSPGAGMSGWKGLCSGLAYVKGKPGLRNLVLFQIFTMFLISPSAFLTPLLVERTFGAEVWRLTAGEMTYSAGMVLGGLLIAAWGGLSSGRLRTTLLAGGFYGLLMVGLGLSPVFPAYLVCNTLIGITSPCYNTPMTVAIQEKVAPEAQGRVFGVLQAASSFAMPLGMVLFGPLSDAVSLRLLFPVCGILVMAAAALAFFRGAFREFSD
ncbi:MAG TPA: MFS transporter [Candidatus Merdivicinus intestinavium]|nr:MFS transporter [Candidatus Merdivicinus intestinavium]